MHTNIRGSTSKKVCIQLEVPGMAFLWVKKITTNNLIMLQRESRKGKCGQC